MNLLEVEHLVKHFPKRGGLLNRVVARVHAVNGVTFAVRPGETLGVVGESGCGKSTLGRLIIRLLDPTAGSIRYAGQEISAMTHRQLQPLRRKLQIIFQDPNSSLNPRMTVGSAIREVVRFHRTAEPSDRNTFVLSLLDKVGLHADDVDKYPHEFSGGQRQRVGIARALAAKPDFVVADEPVSSLDVSIQAQILNLLSDLRREFGLTMLFISHDLKVVEFFCDRVLVMYLGYIVEELACDGLADRARHPYTKALIGAIPPVDPDERRELTVLDGDVPSPYTPPPGCPFVTRCPLREPRCHEQMPPLVEHGPNHRVACWAIPQTA